VIEDVEVPSFELPRIVGEAKLGTWSAGWAILKAMIGERFRPLPRTQTNAVPVAPQEPLFAFARVDA
jgi:hypothetical protein